MGQESEDKCQRSCISTTISKRCRHLSSRGRQVAQGEFIQPEARKGHVSRTPSTDGSSLSTISMASVLFDAQLTLPSSRYAVSLFFLSLFFTNTTSIISTNLPSSLLQVYEDNAFSAYFRTLSTEVRTHAYLYAQKIN